MGVQHFAGVDGQLPPCDLKTAYRPEIDGLRAIAVLAVLFFHVDPKLLPGGFVGVDVFFVISGYLISRNILDDLSRGHFSYVDFYTRRLRRIAPAAIVTMAVCAIPAILLFAPRHLERFGASALMSLFSLGNIYFWRTTDYFDTSADFKPLLHLWTLGVEEQFYFVWPAILAALFAWRRKAFLPVLVGAGLLSLFASQLIVKSYPVSAFYLTPFRMWEFIIGALCLWVPKPNARWSWIKEPLLLLGVGAIVFAAVTYSQQTVFPGLTALVPCLGAALAIHAGDARWSGLILRNRAAVAIGVISYSLYLVHWPIYVFVKYWNLGSIGDRGRAGVFIAAVVAAALMYRFVEQPFRRRESPQALLHSWRFKAIAAVCAVALVPSILVWRGNGWPWRLDEAGKLNWAQYKTKYWIACRKPDFPRVSGHDCAFGTARERPDVILVGDSHAQHWVTGLDALFKRSNISAVEVGRNGLVPLKGTRIYVGQEEQRDVPELARNIERLILEKRPKLVILSGRWTAFDARLPEQGADLRTQYLTYGPYDTLTHENTYAALRASLQAMIAEYRKAGIRVALLGDIPAPAPHTLECMTRPSWLVKGAADFAHCNRRSASAAMRPVAAANSVFRDLKAQFPDDVDVFLPSEAMCAGKEVCDFSDEGGSFYSDDHHLSVHGATVLADRYLKGLVDIVEAQAAK